MPLQPVATLDRHCNCAGVWVMEQDVVTQHFDVPVLKVEGVMGMYSRGFEGRLVVKGVCDREVGQSGDADGWGLWNKRSRDCARLWRDGWFEWR